MEYNMDELLSVTAELTEKYTSRESTSVTYETAHVLMEAVIYCIEECVNRTENGLYTENDNIKTALLYTKGCEFVIEKACNSKLIYEELRKEFHDYGCRNYQDTIINGMPQFFTKYDAKFNPQNHILTLDYPTIGTDSGLCGVDRIYQYLLDVTVEQKFLNYFAPDTVGGFLERVQPDYKELYFDNICFPVLLCAIGCVITDQQIDHLFIYADDCKEIQSYFMNDDLDRAEQKIGHIIKIIMSGISNSEMQSYFIGLKHDYASMVLNGIKNNSLERVFYCNTLEDIVLD